MKEKLSRRGFLKGMLAAGAAVLAEEVIRGNTYSESASARSGESEAQPDVAELSEPHDENPWDAPRLEGEALREAEAAILQFVGRVRIFNRDFEARFQRSVLDDSKQCSMEDQEHTRIYLLQSDLPKQLHQIAPHLVRMSSAPGERGASHFEFIMNTFKGCLCQGVFYDELEKSAKAVHGSVSFPRNETYYAARLQDYVPQGDAIWSQDIDPRNRPVLHQTDKDTLLSHPGWSERRRKAAFKQLAQDQAFIQLAKSNDLTLAEYFSLIKSVINEKEEGSDSLLDIATRHLQMRREFLQKELAGPRTEQAICFYGRDENMFQGADEGGWNQILRTSGVAESRIVTHGTNTQTTPEQTKTNLFQSIANSHGETVITFDTHGSPQALLVDKMQGNQLLSSTELASALIDRLIVQQDSDTLGKVTVMIDACYSNDFAKQLKRDIYRIWTSAANRPFTHERIKLPTIISASQQAAMSFKPANMEPMLKTMTDGIRKDGALTGARLLRNVQPASYPLQDMTFFAAGSNTEFAGRERSRIDLVPV